MLFNIPPVERPAHVPANRVVDFDIYAINSPDAEYQLLVKKMLQSPGIPDVFWTPRNTGHWVAARAVTAQKVLTDSANFSSRQIVVIPQMNPNPPFAPLQIDPPDHSQYRALLMEALSPKATIALGDKARQLAIDLIEGFMARGECEFVGDFATHLPIGIFMTMADLPAEDRPELLATAHTLVRAQSMEDHVEGNRKLIAYAMRKIAERRANPGGDLISSLTKAIVKGQPLDDATLLGMVTLLLTAGLDTVATMMGFFANFLANNPSYRNRLRTDPESVQPAVEELLRRFPIANLAREVRNDCLLEGVELKAGERILVPTMAYNLDDRQFEQPALVDIDRKNKIHETFGDGAHRCMGSMLARVELRVFIEEWLKRIPDFSVKPGTNVQVVAGSVAGIKSLPLVWEVL